MVGTLRFFLSWRVGGGCHKMEYLTVLRVVLGRAARSRMVASTARYSRDHATPSGTTENDAKYREIFHFDDTPPPTRQERTIFILYILLTKYKYETFKVIRTLIKNYKEIPLQNITLIMKNNEVTVERRQ